MNLLGYAVLGVSEPGLMAVLGERYYVSAVFFHYWFHVYGVYQHAIELFIIRFFSKGHVKDLRGEFTQKLCLIATQCLY
jgi:hypothetical protein